MVEYVADKLPSSLLGSVSQIFLFYPDELEKRERVNDVCLSLNKKISQLIIKMEFKSVADAQFAKLVKVKRPFFLSGFLFLRIDT